MLTVIACCCSVLLASGLKAEDLVEGNLDSKEYAEAPEDDNENNDEPENAEEVEKDEDDDSDFTERDLLLESILIGTTTPRNSFKYTHTNYGVKFPRFAVISGKTFQLSNK